MFGVIALIAYLVVFTGIALGLYFGFKAIKLI